MFERLADRVTYASGTAPTVVAAFVVVAVWALSGPVFNFSDTWQLTINTGTTVVTFLMVFIIQMTQNREMDAVHAKLDALIKATPDADNALMHLERETMRVIEERRPK